ncbi:carboxypeptidase-like regulatory domain-containing protein [Pedobacter sp. Du54]|uniref:carboxypeptidase-like regulatory domain-containing protein n=1 Tax=Pedobacter anseongensis TaxID=3133439 RepID=UPI0030A98D2E
MRLVFSFLLIAMFSTLLKAQTLQGKVIDSKTAEPIPFVSIGIIGTNTATVTNENGEFVLKVEKFPIKLRFSHVSYLILETPISEAQNALTIRLSAAAINLNEVVIRADEGKKLLKSALEKAKQYLNTPFYANAFYRQLTSTNDSPTEIHELFYDLKWDVKYVQGWIAKQSRFAEINDPSKFSLNNQSFLTFAYAGYVFPDKKRRYVSISYLDDYEIEVDRYIEQKDQDIAVVTCKLKKTRKNLFYVNSTYYIGVKDLKIYRLENKIYNLPIELSPNLIQKFPPIVETIATFNGINRSISVLESMSTKVYLSLRSNNRVINSVISSLLTVFKIDDMLKNQQFKGLDSDTKDKKVIQSIKYDANFWKNNPIVKQTTLEDAFIKMMESKQAFGTMTNP